MRKEIIVDGRMQQKHDIEANWLKAVNFAPLDGELIVYDKDGNYSYNRIKIGDGKTNVNDLPFIDEETKGYIWKRYTAKEIFEYTYEVEINEPITKYQWSTYITHRDYIDGFSNGTYTSDSLEKDPNNLSYEERINDQGEYFEFWSDPYEIYEDNIIIKTITSEQQYNINDEAFNGIVKNITSIQFKRFEQGDSALTYAINNQIDYYPENGYNSLDKYWYVRVTDGLATKIDVENEVANLVNSAPETLNTLKELAEALGNDENFATTVTNEIAKKANKAESLEGYNIKDAYTKKEIDKIVQESHEGYIWAQYKSAEDGLYSYVFEDFGTIYWWVTIDSYGQEQKVNTFTPEPPEGWQLEHTEPYSNTYQHSTTTFYNVGEIFDSFVIYGLQTKIVSRELLNLPSNSKELTGIYIINQNADYLPENGYNEKDGYYYEQIEDLSQKDKAKIDYVDNKFNIIKESLSNNLKVSKISENLNVITDIASPLHNIEVNTTTENENLIPFPYNLFKGTIATIPIPNADGTRNNIIEPDGTIHLWGYADENQYNANKVTDLASVVLQPGVYTIGGYHSPKTNDNPIDSCDFRVIYYDENKEEYCEYKNSSFVLEEETEVKIQVQVNFGLPDDPAFLDHWYKRYFIRPMLNRGNVLKEWVSPVPVTVFGENILDINKDTVSGYYNCSLTEDNKIKLNMVNDNYIGFSFTNLNSFLENLDGHTLTLYTEDNIANRGVSFNIRYDTEEVGMTNDTVYGIGGNYCSITLNHQGRKIRYFDIKLGYGKAIMTDIDSILENKITLQVGENLIPKYIPYQPIQRLKANQTAIGTNIYPTTKVFLPNSEIEVSYSRDVKNAIENYGYSKEETTKLVKSYGYSKEEVDNKLENIRETIEATDEIILRDFEKITRIEVPTGTYDYSILKYNGNLLPKPDPNSTSVNGCKFTEDFKLKVDPNTSRNYAYFTIGTAFPSILKALQIFSDRSLTLSINGCPNPNLAFRLVFGYSSGAAEVAPTVGNATPGKNLYTFKQPKSDKINYIQVRIYGTTKLTESIILENMQLTFGEERKNPFLFGEDSMELQESIYTSVVENEILPEEEMTVIAVSKAETFKISYQPTILALSNKIQNLKEQINSKDYPSYFEDYLELAIKKARINMLQAGIEGETFVLISDLHWEKNSKNSPKLIKQITKQLPIENTIFCGDAINGGSYETSIENMNEVRIAFTEASKNFLTAQGNHDDNSLNGGDKFENNETYTLLRKQNDYFAIYDEYATPSYYYFDNRATNTRFIFLDSNDEDLNTQLNYWLKNCFSLKYYKYVIFVHQVYDIPTGGKNNDPTTWVMTPFMTKICEYLDSISSECEIKGIFAGHNHYDHIGRTAGGIPIILIDCDCYNQTNTGNSTKLGTINELAFDIVTVNYQTNKINCTRIGRGLNREINIKQA